MKPSIFNIRKSKNSSKSQGQAGQTPELDFPDTVQGAEPGEPSLDSSNVAAPFGLPAFEPPSHRRKPSRVQLATAGIVVLGLGAAVASLTHHKADLAPTGTRVSSTMLAPAIQSETAVPQRGSGVPAPGSALGPAITASASAGLASAGKLNPTQTLGFQNAVSRIIAGASQGAATVQSVQPGPMGLAVATYAIGGREGLAWVDVARGVVFLGQAVAASGQNLNAGRYAMAAQAASAPASQASQPLLGASGVQPSPMGVTGFAATQKQAALHAAMATTNGFLEGTAGPKIWVWFDPDNPQDASYYKVIHQGIDRGQFRVFWVPVAYQNPGSMPRAVDILNSVGPAHALRKNFEQFDSRNSAGGAAAYRPDLKMMQEVNGNLQLLSAVGMVQTPAVMFCTKSSGSQVVFGTPTPADLMTDVAPCATNP
jgi:hypothetical protein